MDGGRRTAVQVGIFRNWFGDQVVPSSEPHQHVNPQRHERLQPVRHRRRLDRQQIGRQLAGEFGRGIQRGARIALEHRGVHHEVQVVRPVQRVEVQRPFAVDETPIHLYRSQIRHHRIAVIAAQHVDVAGHVLQVARVGHQIPQQVRGGQRVLRTGRHLHGVQVEVQDAGVCPAGGGGKRLVENPLGLHHPRAGRRLAGSGVPQRPCGQVDQRVGGQRLHVDVVGISLGQRRHRVGVGGAAGLQGVGVVRVVSGESGLQRLDQPLFDRRRPTSGRQAQFHPRAGQRGRQVDGVERLPCLVVVRSDAYATPHRAIARSGSSSNARSKQRIASSWLNAYDQISPRSHHTCACDDGVSIGR